MVIEDIFCYVSDRIMDTGIFSRGYEYVELKQTNSSKSTNVIKPSYYEGGGYKDIFNLDVNGYYYIRKTGNTTIGKDNDQKYFPTPCAENSAIEMVLPCRCVAVVPKEKTGSAMFADDVLANTIISAIQGNMSTSGMNIKSGVIAIKSINTDAFRIWREEVTGVDFKERDFARFAFVAVDFNIIIKADSSCLSACQNVY